MLSTATVPRSGDAEFTTGAAVPLLLSAIGPALMSVASGKMRVIGTKARSLPPATLTTDTPPRLDTHARLRLMRGNIASFDALQGLAR